MHHAITITHCIRNRTQKNSDEDESYTRYHSLKVRHPSINTAETPLPQATKQTTVPASYNLSILPSHDNRTALPPPPTSLAAPVRNNTRARRVRTRQRTTINLLLQAALDVAPGPAPGVVGPGRLQVDPPAQAPRAEAGRDLLGALGRRRVVDGAVAARRVPMASALHAVRVDAWRALWRRAVGAAVVDVEDVEGVDVAWDVAVCLNSVLAASWFDGVGWGGRTRAG